MPKSWDHAIAARTLTDLATWPGRTCGVNGCHRRATHEVSFTSVTGRRGRTNRRTNHRCETCVARFAERNGLEVPDVRREAVALMPLYDGLLVWSEHASITLRFGFAQAVPAPTSPIGVVPSFYWEEAGAWVVGSIQELNDVLAEPIQAWLDGLAEGRRPNTIERRAYLAVTVNDANRLRLTAFEEPKS